MTKLNAEEARALSASSTYGTEETLNSIYKSIESNAKTGKTKITKGISKESVSDEEFAPIVPELESKGYTVEVLDQGSRRTIIISWA
ncbi:MAG: hypothetical protein GY695_05330 [Aestuariibacter sp.]|jgi:hypothetical protein|uniref:hypothetical protein n=1 Tax=Marisediminitalea aggregata TaxID=634436 RepID=UPI0020CE0EB5|nr:hypothetical protein [Marisediminitalea aggregata]MCP3862554.1 hypothetical protein [Aestuariibacter sp.]MCP4524437.1 hypothetical protein [Aestuariibacter sp.]MCP5010839.1 hypothetical protein [Aestuariibacter sp.]MCP9476370.1 hypothetical protein [Marisediminitalea aggregata]